MTATSANLSDTSTWLPLEGLARGFDANRAPHSLALSGTEVKMTDDRGTTISHRFSDHRVTWSYRPGTGDPRPESEGEDDYIAFEVDDGLYFAQFHHEDKPDEAVSLVVDRTNGRALSVVSVLGKAQPGTTAVQHHFAPSVIDGAEVHGEEAAPTTELIGRRALWVYSSEHAYEHVYLTPHWYTWQCLAGPERGLADTDENSAWQVAAPTAG